MPRVPACTFCGEECLGVIAREFTTWEARRSAVGASRMVGRRKYTGRIACESCTRDIANGLTPNTPKLFR